MLEARERFQQNKLKNPTHDENTASTATASVQDGIIRPNGQVTQVAPDDWVFAVRDVNKLASAFSPPAQQPLLPDRTPETVTTMLMLHKDESKLQMRSWAAEWQEIEQCAMEVLPSLVTHHNNMSAPQDIVVNQTPSACRTASRKQ